jgi:hypothetical protein
MAQLAIKKKEAVAPVKDAQDPEYEIQRDEKGRLMLVVKQK